MPPRLGAAFSIPTSTLLFWCLAPFSIHLTEVDLSAAGLFAVIGLLFPAAVALLNFESNRLMGPNISGAVSGLAPLFAVLLVGRGRTRKSPRAKNGGRRARGPARSQATDWRAAFARDELIAAHGADYAMPNLLNHLAAPGCNRLGSHWDRCGVHYVEPVDGSR